jgi:uncharacterized protein (TIGR03435 family)
MTLFRPANPVIFLFAALGCFAQAPAFDVASVRPSPNAANGLNQLNDGREPIHTSPGSLTIRGASLRVCIQWAYDIPPFQIEGPAWLKDTGFDIVAKAAGSADDDHMRLMLRTLLATRFGLKAHSERKEIQVYELTLAKGGPKFHESTTEGAPIFSSPGKDALVAEHATMSDFAEKISEALGRPVMDATGLKGHYDLPHGRHSVHGHRGRRSDGRHGFSVQCVTAATGREARIAGRYARNPGRGQHRKNAD